MKALEKIRRAPADATYLDLGRCGLTEWPNELFELEHLKVLIMSNRWWDPFERSWKTSENTGPDNLLTHIPESIRKLKNLTCLVLNGSFNHKWQIVDLRPLQLLPDLSELACAHNQLEDIAPLEKLPSLRQLDLRNNPIKDISVLESLTELTQLSLSSTKISSVDGLEKLPHITHLYLSGNQISDISALKVLADLTHLDLRSTNVSDISPLSDLREISHLYFSGNYIRDLSVLEGLTNITYLDLRSTKTADITVLGKLTKMTRLYLSYNPVSDIRILEKLPALTHLDLRSTKISDQSVLKKLPDLIHLNLRSTKMSDITFLQELPGIRELDLRNNEISDIRVLENLPKLKKLHLSYNPISDIGVLEKLPGIEWLSLASTKVADVTVLNQLPDLRQLDLSYNQISDLKPLENLMKKGLEVSLRELVIEDGQINLAENPLTSPPLEIVRQGRGAILNYFESLEKQGEETVYEAKLLILGEAGAGKTTLARKLQNPDADMPDEVDDTTTGIEVTPHHFPGHGDLSDFTMNIWDFGGQEIYHATHQFFLSTRSLYVLLADGRLEENLDYWFQVQELLGGNSPLLLVLNQKGKIRQDIPLNDLRGLYPNLKVLEKVDLKNDREGIVRLVRTVEHYIRHLPHLVEGEKLPKPWAQIRESLSDLEDPYIPLRTFRGICRENGIEEPFKQDFLSSYLHDLGAMLHFKEEPLLKDIIILNPEWATRAVYSILKHTEDYAAVKGHFTRTDLQRVWKAPTYQDMFDKLLALMSSFELCYAVPSEQNLYIVPQLLPSDKPQGYHWDDTETTQVRYTYDFMPKGILTRLMVRMHQHIADQKSQLWRRGVVFQNGEGNTSAQVLELPRDKEINIRIRGPHTRELLTIILHEIHQINKTFRFNEKMNVHCLFPCNCSQCQHSDDPNFYEHAVLQHYLARKRPTIECNKSFEDVPVLDLIDRLANLPKPRAVFVPEENPRQIAYPELIVIENNPVITVQPQIHSPQEAIPSFSEPAATPVKPETIRWYETWTVKSIAGGVGGGLVVGLLLARWAKLPFFDSWLAAGAVIIVVLLRRNPRNVFRDFAYYALGIVAVVNALPAFNFLLKEESPQGARKLFQFGFDDAPVLSIGLVFLAAWAIYLHFRNIKGR